MQVCDNVSHSGAERIAEILNFGTQSKPDAHAHILSHTRRGNKRVKEGKRFTAFKLPLLRQ